MSKGESLSIFLDHDLLSTTAIEPVPHESPFNGLDHLELIYVDRVHIDLPNGGLFNKQAVQAKAHATVSCEGAFHFDFHQSLASLNTNVVLNHFVVGFTPDTFHSNRLDLHFDWTAKAKSPSTSKNDSVGLPTHDWTIDRIEAVVRFATICRTPRVGYGLKRRAWIAEVKAVGCKSISIKNRIAIRNHLPGVPAVDSSQVYLQRESMQVWSPEIEYSSQRIQQFHSKNKSSSDNESLGIQEVDHLNESISLGTLWAAGPGQATLVAEDW